MRGTSLLLGLALAGMTYFAQAATPATPPAPTIAIHGKAIVLPGAAHQPDPNMRQRAVFSLTVDPASAAATDPGLDRVARAVNLLTANRMPQKQLDFVLMLSEGDTDSALAEHPYHPHPG